MKYPTILLGTALLLAGCGGSGGGGDDDDSPPATAAVSTTSVSGGATKGPFVEAEVDVFRFDPTAADGKGEFIASAETGDDAQIEDLEIPDTTTGPLLFEFRATDDTEDLTTGEAPIIETLVTVLPAAEVLGGRRVFATPQSTMAVGIALDYADTPDFGGDGAAPVTAAEAERALDNAAQRVKSMFGFGLIDDIDIYSSPPLLIAGETDDPAAQAAVARYRTAIEALGALAQQVSEDVNAANSDSATDADAIFAALIDDAGDGAIDGNGDAGAIGTYGGSGAAAAANTIATTDPETLPIPNAGGLMVADTSSLLVNETDDTDNDDAESGSVAGTDTSTEPGAAESDIDGDGNPDSIDTDIDGDGSANAEDAWPLDPSEQIDTDGDGTGNNADGDDDNDSVSDADEALAGTNALLGDSDGDGDGDADEIGGDAASPADGDGDGIIDALDSATADSDSDGVNDEFDTANDDPTNDSDGDSFGNDIETTVGTDPLDAASLPLDTDGDGDPNALDNDDDNDGIQDDDEAIVGTDPLEADSDGDGVNDFDELGGSIGSPSDGDGDGIIDALDSGTADSDGDGVVDEIDNANDSPANDTDGDGVPNQDDDFPLDPTRSDAQAGFWDEFDWNEANWQ